MSNFIAFVNTFLSYLLVFAVFSASIIASIFIGKFLRKRKDAKVVVDSAKEE